jgi:protein SCO1/2
VIAWLTIACGANPVYIVEGTVVEVRPPDSVVLDHEEIPGFMAAMVMPFDVADPASLAELSPGDRVVARFEVSSRGSRLTQIRVTAEGSAPEVAEGPTPLRVGDVMPALTLPTHDGSTIALGPEQPDRVALTFIYTRCPEPAFCPAMFARLQALDAALSDAAGVRLVAVTLDPDHDTPDVLAAHAAKLGLTQRFALVRAPDLEALAMRAGLPVVRTEGSIEIAHGLRLLVLDRGGKLLERYDDARFPLDRVVTQLRTGAPAGDPNRSGTLTLDATEPQR